jgi:hypothetical protein
MTIMTWTIFEGRTGKMGAALRARGKNPAKVDKALKRYCTTVASANAAFQKINKPAAREQLSGTVDFLTKQDRKAFIAIPQGGLFVDGTGNAMNAPNPADAFDRYPYAMDVYGNFFTKAEASTRANVDSFNHSGARGS